MVNTSKLRQIFPLRENTLRHVVEGDGRYPRALTPSEQIKTPFLLDILPYWQSKKIYLCRFKSSNDINGNICG